jgi:aminopeptidase N
VYNKGAMVLHMLRRLVGDDVFFAGVRTFYDDWKFRKAGTDDFRKAMEKASGRDLTGFFESWIYGAAIPEVKFGYSVRESEVEVRFEQREAVDLPITVIITYATGPADEVVVALKDKVTTVKLPVKGAVRNVTANADNAALAEIVR